MKQHHCCGDDSLGANDNPADMQRRMVSDGLQNVCGSCSEELVMCLKDSVGVDELAVVLCDC